MHLAEFPRGIEQLLDADLETRWTRLREIRDQVNAALETARQEKLIGTSLQAALSLTAGGETAALLRRYEADLPMLFIVSQATLDASGPEGVSVSVSRAEGSKCERCWRIVPEVSAAPGTEGLCDRCIDALPSGPSTSLGAGPSTGLGTGGGREVA